MATRDDAYRAPPASRREPREIRYFYESAGWRLVPTAVWWLLLIGGLVAVVLTGTAASSTFLDQASVRPMLFQFLVPAVLVPSMVLILAAGGIDFSVGAVACLTGTLIAKWTGAGVGPELATLQAVGVAAGVGLLNGLLVSLVGLSAFIATLGTMAAAAGVCALLGQGVTVNPDTLGRIATLPRSFAPWGALIFFGVVGTILVQLTPFGRRPKANEAEPRERAFARIFYTTLPFLLSGLAAGCVGVYLLADAASARPFLASVAATGAVPELSTIQIVLFVATAAVLGGTPVGGGYGTVLGGLLAALLLTVGSNVALLKHVPESTILIAQGGVLLGAALLTRVFFGLISLGFGRKRGLTAT